VKRWLLPITAEVFDVRVRIRAHSSANHTTNPTSHQISHRTLLTRIFTACRAHSDSLVRLNSDKDHTFERIHWMLIWCRLTVFEVWFKCEGFCRLNVSNDFAFTESMGTRRVHSFLSSRPRASWWYSGECSRLWFRVSLIYSMRFVYPVNLCPSSTVRSYFRNKPDTADW